MAEYFISNTRGGGTPDGSQSNPFPSLIAAQEATGYQGFWLSNNTFRLWAEDTFDDRINIADKPTLGSNFIIEPWTDITNSSKKPIMTRAKRSFNWTYDAVNDVWVSDALANIRYGGCILEDGEPLDWRIWTTSRAITAQTMVPGTACFDNLSLQYFIKPRTATPSSHLYAACAGIAILRLSRGGSFRISAIDFQLSSQGLSAGGGGAEALRGGWTIEDCDFSFMGGSVDAPNAVALGNGLGISDNTGVQGTSYIKRCRYLDIFDSGLSPQQWENNATIKDIEIIENEAIRCGLTGFEVSLTSQSGTYTNLIENVNIRKSIARDGGYGWSGNRYGSTANGFAYLTNDSSPNSILRNCVIDRCEAINNIGKGYCLYHTSGNISVFRSKAKNCLSAGILQTSRGGFGLAVNHAAYDNYIENCGRGLLFGGSEGGKAGSSLRAHNNFIIGCDIGISNNNVTGETTIAEYNTVVNCDTGVRNFGSGVFNRANNGLYGNTVDFTNVSQGTDIILASQPTIRESNYGLKSPYLSSYYFSKNDLTAFSKNSVVWEGVSNNYTVPQGETEKGLEFSWAGSLDPRIDQSYERRFDFIPSKSFYLRKRIHIPANYYHRACLEIVVSGDISSWAKGDAIVAADGTSDATVYFIDADHVWLLFAENNIYGDGVWTGTITNTTRGESRGSTRYGNSGVGRKFIALWCDGYSGSGQGPTIVFGLNPDYLGGSVIDYSFGADGAGVGQTLPNSQSSYEPFIRVEDAGKWFDVVFRIEMATSEAAADGIIALYLRREGEAEYTRIFNQTNARIGPRAATGNVLFKSGYLFGYWNGGVEVDTKIHVSEFELFDTRPRIFRDGVEFTLIDASTNNRQALANNTSVSLTTYTNASSPEVSVYSGTISSGGNIEFRDIEWVAGESREGVIKAGQLRQSVVFDVTEL